MEATLGEARSGRDGLSFVAAVGFAVALYASIVNLFPALEPLRPALLTAGVAAAALLFGRVASGLKLDFDGGRGLALIGLAGWSLLSVRWSVAPEASRTEAIELLKLTAIYLTIVNVATTPRRVVWLCAAAVLASLAPSIGAIDRWYSGTDLVDGYRARWLGVYADPNHLAMSLVAIVPIAATLAMSSKTLAFRVLGLGAGGLAVAAIVLTHSRGGALGLLLALVLWSLSGPRKLRSLAAGIAVAGAVAIFAPSSFWNRTETIAQYEIDASAQGRIWAWEVAAAINRDKPLTGVGAGGFLHAWPDYARYEARGTPYVAHNIFLAMLAELGLIGFLLFVAFVARAVSGAVGAASDPVVGPLSRAVAAGFAGYVLCDMLSGYVLSAHFFFLAALASSCERAARGSPERAAAPPSRSAVLTEVSHEA